MPRQERAGSSARIASTIASSRSASLLTYLERMSTTSTSIKLTVNGEAVCEGPLHAPIISDESTFSLDDTPEGRMLTVTMTKAKETSGNQHWKCANKGEGKVDTSKFGVPVKTINPYDINALKDALEPA